MRLLLLFLLAAGAAFPQLFSYGAKIGHPVRDALSTWSRPGAFFTAASGRYTIGPTVELLLPYRASIEFDVLYRPVRYNVTETPGTPLASVTAGEWRFPLLAKYRFRPGVVAPYAAGGMAWQKFTGVRNATSSGLSVDGATGAVIAAGIEGKLVLVHLSGELRYTHWGSASFHTVDDSRGRSNQNQVDLLIGVRF